MNKPLHWVFFLLCCPLGFACRPSASEEALPTYFVVASSELTTSPDREGSASANITELWLTVAGQALGAYRAGVAIPVLGPPEGEVLWEAGIWENGLSATPVPYPFYAPIRGDRQLTPLKIDTLSLSFRYRNDARFAWLEDFETGQDPFPIELESNSGIRFESSDRDPFEGTRSGLLELPDGTSRLSLATDAVFTGLTRNGEDVFAEIDFRADVPFLLGIGSASGTDLFFRNGVLPSREWKKIYLNLGPLIKESQLSTYRLVFRAFVESDDQRAGDGIARVWLDNLKIVHF